MSASSYGKGWENSHIKIHWIVRGFLFIFYIRHSFYAKSRTALRLSLSYLFPKLQDGITCLSYLLAWRKNQNQERLVSNTLYVMRIQQEVLKRGGLTNATLATSRNLLRLRERALSFIAEKRARDGARSRWNCTLCFSLHVPVRER